MNVFIDGTEIVSFFLFCSSLFSVEHEKISLNIEERRIAILYGMCVFANFPNEIETGGNMVLSLLYCILLLSIDIIVRMSDALLHPLM